MPTTFRLLFPTLTTVCLLGTTAAGGDWPWWRGPDRNGIAEPDQEVPEELASHVKWAVDVPGRGHGSACVVGDRVFLAAADEKTGTQSLICFGRDTGALLWTTVVHRDGMTQKSNKKASWASGTPACDGERVYISFVHGDSASTTALDLEGRQVWQTRITDYTIHQGYGSSPAIWGELVIVSADNKAGGAVCGLDRKSGRVVWKVARDAKPNYPSPVILEVAGKVQLFLTGTDKVTSLDPANGQVNWEIDGATTECVTSTVTDGRHIYTSGGYPKNHVAAVVADGSGTVAWENGDRVYVPSMIVKDGMLHAVMDNGVAVCWDAATGEEKWKKRLGGTFSSSPVLVGERFYAANESGDLFVYRADAAGLELLATNRVGDEVYATPSIAGGDIILRVAFYHGERRAERLVCWGN